MRILVAGLLALLTFGTVQAIPVQVNINQLEQGGFGLQPVTAGSFSQISPNSINYDINDDFKFFVEGAILGNITGFVDSVMGVGTGGCEASDYLGFTSGSIALMVNTTCLYSDQINLAAGAGAIAALVVPASYSSGTSYGYAAPVSIASILISEAVGDSIQQTLDSVSIPEPMPLSLLLFGLSLLLVVDRRRRSEGGFSA